MNNWIYYSAFFSIDGAPDQPLFLMRLRVGDPEAAAERLDKSGQWLHSSTLIEISRGGSDLEVQAISRSEAAEFARDRQARAVLPYVPEDLT